MNSRITTVALLILVVLINSCKNEPPATIESDPSAIALVKLKRQLQELDDQFAESFNTGDSIAVAEHYTVDGTFGAIKGKDNLISAWGRAIRQAHEKETILNFNVSSVSHHGEFIVEIGSAESLDVNNTIISSGNYLVVRKMEDGKWKIYRDIGL